MKLSTFLGILMTLLAIAAATGLAPIIGLGRGDKFVLFQFLGLRRGLAVEYALVLASLLCIFQVLSIGIVATPSLPKWRAVLKVSWKEGATTFAKLSCGTPTVHMCGKEWAKVALIGLAFAVTFATLLAKNGIASFENEDQIWHQAFVDYDVDWHTPIFSFAGNVLNNFGIQPPLNTQLLPVLGLSQLFAHHQHILAALIMFSISMALLFWAIGATWGIPPVSRAVFAGLVTSITTIPFPYGPDLISWPLPPNFFTAQFLYGLWWQEAHILFLVTVIFFYWIGQGKSVATNILCGVGFASGCFLVVLGYPFGGIYFAPLIGLYCLTLFFTSVVRAVWMWKGAACAAIVVTMLAAKVPQFFANLYSYSFGAYFADMLKAPISQSFYNIFIVNAGGGDWGSSSRQVRALIIVVVSIATVAVSAVRGTGALRRFAIAILVCEAVIIAIGSVNALVFRVPMALEYAENAHAPLWGAYLVLVCMTVAVVIDRRLAALPIFASAGMLPLLRYISNHRRKIYASALAAILLANLLPPLQGFAYPFSPPSIAQLLAREVAIIPDAPFRGRVLSITVESKAYKTIKQYVALLPSGIPTANEFMHWTSPLTFVFLRAFFGHDRDIFHKQFFPLTAYDPKIARLMGVRMVISNVELSDGMLLHEQRAEDSDLRIYRLDGVNLGQFSPTRPVRVATAVETVAAMKAASFDPQRDVVVESELPANLVPAVSASITVDAGPKLHIRATSHGHSLLVLPFEFSHCLRLHAPMGTSARLLPVNLQQTGLLFEGQAEVWIEYRYGLFWNTQCRGTDLDRANALRLRELVELPKARLSASGPHIAKSPNRLQPLPNSIKARALVIGKDGLDFDHERFN